MVIMLKCYLFIFTDIYVIHLFGFSLLLLKVSVCSVQLTVTCSTIKVSKKLSFLLMVNVMLVGISIKIVDKYLSDKFAYPEKNFV